MTTPLEEFANTFEVGDLVEASDGWALRCGCGLYPRAVVASINPFVLISEAGDML